MHKVLKSNKARFKNTIESTKNAIVVALPSMNRFVLEKYGLLTNKHAIKSKITLKRLFYKMFVGERARNEKTPYSENLHLLVPTEKTNYAVFSRIRAYGGKFVGSICDGKFSKNYGLAIKSQFNSNKAAVLLLAKLLSLVAVVAKNSKILNKDH